MNESIKLDKKFIEAFKIKTNLIDFVKSAYKPILYTYIPDEKKSETENIIADEYHRLIFYMGKTKRLFETLRHSLKELTVDSFNMENEVVRTELIRKISENHNSELVQSLRDVFDSTHFKLFLTISTIPSNTEFHYIGILDSLELENWINEFDLVFKRYIGNLLKKSLIMPEEEVAKLMHF